MAMSWITSLPEDIIIDFVARVPRRYYPTLSMVSKLFRFLIASPELYERRSLLDRTECCLYVTMSTYDDGHRLYTLVKKSNSASNYCLVPITSLPRMPIDGTYVAVDSKIFVMGGYYKRNTSPSSNVLLIDCRLHTAHHDLPNMPMAVASPVSSFINGKIYVIGGYPTISDGEMGLMVFDLKTETWESKTRPDMVARKWYSSSSVTWDHKVYFKTLKDSFVYDPNEDRFEKDEVLNTNPWYDNDCVMEGVLYYYCAFWKRLEGYDLKERCWKVVKGVGRLISEPFFWTRTVMYHEKVVVFLQKECGEEIWCAEIKVERDEEGEICGRVEWCACVFEGPSPHVIKCLVVKV